jgi:hypothetical protein
MKKLLCLVTVAGLLLLGGPARAEMAFGVFTNGPAPAAPLSPSDGPERDCDVFIDFDAQNHSCGFDGTAALRDEYSGQGVIFAGSGPLDGGGLLDECGNFGVSGYSSPNFLAFNCGASFADGGVPRSPQTLTFSAPVSVVSVLVGSGTEAMTSLYMEAYDVDDQLVDSTVVTLQPALQLIAVSGVGITRVVLGGTHNCLWVADDLCFTYDDPVPAVATTWGHVKSVYR